MFDITTMLRLYFVAGSQDCRHLSGDPTAHLLRILQQALEHGITCFQFRDKGAGSLENDPIAQQQLAVQCRDLCRRYAVPFIVNDDVGLALAIEADGIHVGQSDMRAAQIRAKTDRTLIVGLSVNTMEQAQANNHLKEIDYFGIGPIFPTQSKADQKPAVGMSFIAQLRQQNINKPLVAIGGITRDSATQLRAFGADGIAVISAITRAQDVPAAVNALRHAVD
ncbi:thiamine phosphate synthase [Necropsobacter massiliensis]|uniref:thiamine phosphate synthase n=1 Tax=Necropsobacter massiliensis TaxID=1400001 RepID=UPI0005963B8B|nr:thiamine phosphate synthase [Necropsobacter massiliensis]